MRLGQARRGNAWQARLGMAGRDLAGFGVVWFGAAGMVRHG